MPILLAGAAKVALKPRVGADLVGYSQEQLTTGIHDEIHARALVLDDSTTPIALLSVEICVLPFLLVQMIRDAASLRTGIRPENIFIFTTHTHSAPGMHQPGDWDEPAVNQCVEAIAAAHDSRQPAQIGFGFGRLEGYSINRRWLDRPVDPALGVIRVDRADGSLLAALGCYANHAVVLGYDNLLISGDWPGASSRMLEDDFGGDFVALFAQSACGDVNPLTETVRRRLEAGEPVKAIGEVSSLYGSIAGATWDIGDRAGGTFEEAEVIARAYNAELRKVWDRIRPEADAALWVDRVIVNAAPTPEEPPQPELPPDYAAAMGDVRPGNIPLEQMFVGITTPAGKAVLIGHPGETFSENAVELRKHAQRIGYALPLLVGYANGWYSYLPPSYAYDEGGYEVGAALFIGISRHTQDRLLQAAIEVLQRHV